MIKTLPIGTGTNVDVSAASAHEGVSVAYYNCYLDRAGAVRTLPGLELYDSTGVAANNTVYEYYSRTFDTRLTVSAGRVWAQYAKDGARIELTGSGLSVNVPPTFAEDSRNIFVAADSPIYKIVGSTMVGLATSGTHWDGSIINSPTNVTSLISHEGFLLANGPEVPGDTVYSDSVGADGFPDYLVWEVYNNANKPDRLQTLILVEGQYIYNIGPETLEVTYFGSNTANPFELNRGRFSIYGTIAKYSPVYDGTSVYYLSEVAQSRKVISNTGGVPTAISFPVDLPIEQFARVDDAEGFMTSFRGQNFYCLHFPNAQAVVNEQYWQSITLAYHLQNKSWIILAKWNELDSQWTAYRGGSTVYIEPWNVRLVGSLSDGNTYRVTENDAIDYTLTPVFQHRWRNDNKQQWGNPRNIPIGVVGEYNRPPDQTQCGMYRNRQHEFSYSDTTDAGEIFRAAVITGNVHHGSDATKRSNFYRYNVKRGTNDFIINTITEDVDVLRS